MNESARHLYRNGTAAVTYGNPAWQAAKDSRVIDMLVDYSTPNVLRRSDGHQFVNLCSCSYLGLHSHQDILEGAISAIRKTGALDLPISRIRLRLNLLEEFEEGLSDLFGARTICAVTSSAATSGVLPLIASGHMIGDGRPPVMIFDRHAHFSMDYIKPICADETLVLTCRHNDLDFLESAAGSTRTSHMSATGSIRWAGLRRSESFYIYKIATVSFCSSMTATRFLCMAIEGAVMRELQWTKSGRAQLSSRHSEKASVALAGSSCWGQIRGKIPYSLWWSIGVVPRA